MKKIVFTCFTIINLFSATFAQTKGNIELGFNTGLNAGSADSDERFTDIRYGFNLTMGGDYYFSDRWSVKSKIIYDQKGWDNDFPIGNQPAFNTPEKVDFKLNYITIPVLANWHFGSNRNWYIHFGPYAGFLLSAKQEKQDIKEYFNKTDFGANFGIGVKIPVTDKLKINLEYDVQFGTSEIFTYNENSKITNTRASINLGVNFLVK